MPKFSMWWLFLVLFGLTIGGVQSLGWFTRSASAQSQVAPAGSIDAISAAVRHQNGETKHWRSLVMQQ